MIRLKSCGEFAGQRRTVEACNPAEVRCFGRQACVQTGLLFPVRERCSAFGFVPERGRDATGDRGNFEDFAINALNLDKPSSGQPLLQ